MKWFSRVVLATALAGSSGAIAAEGRTQLDFLEGQWAIHDPSGAEVGRSRIAVQAPGAMLFEERKVGEDAQPLWFENSETDKGWVQLFVGASGLMREFKQTSAPGVWPMIMTGDVVLRDGTPATFRLTMSRASNDETRRLLEMSRDKGGSWSPVFDYTYRRVAQTVEAKRGW